MTKELFNETYDALMREYHNSDVGMGEILWDFQVPKGFSFYEALEFYAEVMHQSDGDYLRRGNEDEGWEEDLYTGEMYDKKG